MPVHAHASAPLARRRLTPRRGLRLVRPANGTATPPTSDGPAADTDGEAARFGRFEVLGRVGAGAMSAVFAAHDPSLGRKVAIKRVLDDGDEEARARAQLEAQALARVSHPNVVQVFEHGVCAGQTFVAMEYVEGVTLREWQAAAPRTGAETLRMYVQAGRGLAAAHAAGVMHRDFKADNVVVGRDGRARVVDFGLALLVGAPRAGGAAAVDPGTSARLTIAGVVLGTPAYMSPEQHRGRALDERSDQFNFCAVLYEALYKVRPFAGETLAEVATQVRRGAMQRPLAGTIESQRVHAALLRGLSVRPERRWPSLTALLDHLEASERPRAPRRLLGTRRDAWLVASMGAVGLLAIGASLAPLLSGPVVVGALGVMLVVVGLAWLVAGARVRAPRPRSSGTP